MSSFSDFMKRINPLKPPLVSYRFNSILYNKDGTPDWGTVPLNTPVKFYITKKGDFSFRKTSIEIKATLKEKHHDPNNVESPYRFLVTIKDFDEVQRRLYSINRNNFFNAPIHTAYYKELKLDLPND